MGMKSLPTLTNREREREFEQFFIKASLTQIKITLKLDLTVYKIIKKSYRKATWIKWINQYNITII